MKADDIIWQYYPIGDKMSKTVIFFNSQLSPWAMDKFYVELRNETNVTNEIDLTLTFFAVENADSSYVYECVCNIYTACAVGDKISKTLFYFHTVDIR